MTDWKQLEQVNQDRSKQKSGNDIGKGIFICGIDSSSGENQSAKLTYAGGERSIPIPMPFDSSSSWIRSIPESNTQALASYRTDTQDVCFLAYVSERPDSKLNQYRSGLSAYRPLNPGEHEIHSSGMAQSFYSSRPVVEHRGGVIRSWLDQDRLECGQKSPLHTRQIYAHASNALGDEERFGVVRRPRFLLSPVTIALCGGITSYNFFDYPYPDFTLPGGVPALQSVALRAVAEASAAAGLVTGQFKKRFFGKEYLRIINNSFPLPSKLVDIREGHVFDDYGFQAIGGAGAYLRAKHEYYTSMMDSTSFTVDEMGNVSWSLSLGAFTSGWTTTMPAGAWKLTCGGDLTGTGVDIKTLGTIATKSVLSTEFTAVTTAKLAALVATTIEGKVSLTEKTEGIHSLSAGLNSTMESKVMTEIKSAIINATATTMMNLKAPIVTIGQTPSTPCVLGTELTTWLGQLITLILSNQTFISMGNMGSPTTLNPAIASGLSSLQGQLPTLLSTSITVTK